MSQEAASEVSASVAPARQSRVVTVLFIAATVAGAGAILMTLVMAAR